MEIVIKIDEDVYTRLFDNGIQDNEIATDDICEMARSLRNGIPLPERHGRLIDENELKKEAIRCEWSRSMYYTLDHTLSYMKPIIEADGGSENEANN